MKKIAEFFICGVVFFILFAIAMFWPYPPVETYSFHTTAANLRKEIVKYVESHEGMTYVSYDDFRSGLEICTVSPKGNSEYYVRCKDAEKFWKKSPNAELELVTVIDDMGGMKNNEESDIREEKLVARFEEIIVGPLRKKIENQ